MNTTPIEFMAWDKLDNVMHYMPFIHNYDGYLNDFMKLEYLEFMQLTALRSINDEPIYNHMIVKNKNGNHFIVDMFDYTKMFYIACEKLEIVGNRFQSPHLLELCK
ncbi:MAG: hypothetical protein WC464_00160 [Bdellovibrionales bacterium]|jgi:hypothetical protein